MTHDIKYFDISLTCKPEDLGMHDVTDDYMVISNCLHKIQQLFADDWKYGSSYSDYKKLLQLKATANNVLKKYNKQLRH
ncbi:MAG: hypothetical protein EBU90_14240 [Proteobacteria bacterium]|nr:hypothetical protein [Pseudomonadota bacterium]NBP14257.1 hypothetical protein [bacterium]